MISRTTKSFRSLLAALPADIRRQARDAYEVWSKNPRHPSLHFKKVHAVLPIWSVRITQSYRAVGVLRDNAMVWFWIGAHAEYERVLRNL